MSDYFDGLATMWGIPTNKSSKPQDPKTETPNDEAPTAPVPAPSAAAEQQAANQVEASTPEPVAPAPTPSPQPAPTTAPAPQPSGMVPMQQTVTGTYIPKELRDKEKAIGNKMIAAQEDATKASIEQNNAIAEHNKQQSLDLAALNQRQATQLAYDEEKKQAKMGEVQKALDEYNANKKVDPDRYKKNLGVGGRILAAIAQGLGAFGAAVTHSPNYAQQMIERAIDADIKAQQSDIDARGHAVSMASNNLAMWRQKGLDNQASLAAERVNLLQQSGAKLDEILASSKNPQLLAQGAQIKAGIEKSINETMMHYGAQQVSTVNGNPAAAGARSFDDQLKMRALEVSVPQVDPKTGKEAGFKTILAKSPQDAEKVRDALTVSRQIKANLAEMKHLVATTSQSLNPAAKAKVQKIDDTLRTQFAVLHHLGALSDQDYKIAGQLGDPTSLFQRDSTTRTLIDQYGSSLDSMVEGELRGRGMLQ